MRVFSRHRTRERGATAVEVALLTPLLATILIGIMEFGGLYASQQDLRAATREGARLAADPAVDRDTVILQTEYNVAHLSDVTITVDPDVELPCDGRDGLEVTVRAEMPETIDVLFVGRAHRTLYAESTFLCEP